MSHQTELPVAAAKDALQCLVVAGVGALPCLAALSASDDIDNDRLG
jgi:hypothetical protein